MYSFKNKRNIGDLRQRIAVITPEEPSLLIIKQSDDDVLLPGLSAKSYAFSKNDLNKKRRQIQTVLQQANDILLKQSE